MLCFGLATVFGFDFVVKDKRAIRHYRSCDDLGFVVVVLAL